MVNIQAYVLAIHNLTSEANSKELAQFCRKWLEETGDKISTTDADRIVATLNSPAPTNPRLYTLGVVTVLVARLSKVKTDAEILEYIKNVEAILPSLDALQLGWAPDIYDRLFEGICQHLLTKNIAIWGIKLLEQAILTFTRNNPGHMTNLHAPFFALCLKAQHFGRALPFLQIDVVDLYQKSPRNKSSNVPGFQNTNDKVSSSDNAQQTITTTAVAFFRTAMNTVSGTFGPKPEDPKPAQPLLKRKNMLLYFYYGAMIYGALERWEDAVLFLEHVICLPTKKTSLIQLEALKKYLIISLIAGHKKPLHKLPKYRTPVISRNLLLLAINYTKLPSIIQGAMDNKQDVASVLTAYLNEKQTQFAKDQNVGLMKVLINSCRENAVTRLSNIFVSLQLNDVARMAHLPVTIVGENDQQQESVEQIILRLRRISKLKAHIDDRTQTVIFEEKSDGQTDENMGNNYTAEQIDAAMADVVAMTRTIQAFDEAIRLTPYYIEKTMQKSKMPGGSGNGGQGSSSMYPEEDDYFGSYNGSP